MGRLTTLTDRLRSSLWFIPALFAIAALVLAAATLYIDRHVDGTGLDALQFGGSADGARSVLAAIAQSMLTFTALVFTITMLVLQLASSQLSPRVMRTFLRDRGNQIVLGLFVATFLYTLLVLKEVRSPQSGSEFVPGFSIFVAFLLLVACVAAFIYYIDHMAHAIQATAVLDSIAAETRSAVDRLFPEREAERRDATPVPDAHLPLSTFSTIAAAHAGNVVTVDAPALVATLADANTSAELIPRVGDFVPADGPLFRVVGRADDELCNQLRSNVTIRSERSLQQDAAYGFRQIVDVAVRALSPGINDPTTAVQAIDRLHDLLRRLIGRSIRREIHSDSDGRRRITIPVWEWSDYLDLAVDEIRLSGSTQQQVLRRLREMLEDLADVAPERRLADIRKKLAVVARDAAELDRRSGLRTTTRRR